MAKSSILERIDSGEKARLIPVTSGRVTALSRCTNEPLQRHIGNLGGQVSQPGIMNKLASPSDRNALFSSSYWLGSLRASVRLH
jgi:hypothetical protein